MRFWDEDDGALMFDGLEDALEGLALVWHPDGQRLTRYIYSGPKIVEKFMHEDGMTYDEAVEMIDFNVEGAYAGPQTPIVMWPGEEE